MRAATLLALLPSLAVAAPSRRSQPAPLVVPRGAQLVSGKYIVKLKGDAHTGSLESAINAVVADADHVYNTEHFRGFASGLTDAELKDLQNNPDVGQDINIGSAFHGEG